MSITSNDSCSELKSTALLVSSPGMLTIRPSPRSWIETLVWLLSLPRTEMATHSPRQLALVRTPLMESISQRSRNALAHFS